jgi:hypothetical protein
MPGADRALMQTRSCRCCFARQARRLPPRRCRLNTRDIAQDALLTPRATLMRKTPAFIILSAAGDAARCLPRCSPFRYFHYFHFSSIFFDAADFLSFSAFIFASHFVEYFHCRFRCH